jgi:apolipoprotein N-acyltransferase
MSVRVAAVHIADADGSLANQQFPAAADGYDLVAMPEYSEFFNNPSHKAHAADWFGKGSVIVTSQSDDQLPKHNQLYVYDTATDGIQLADKQFIIPGGETLPYAARLFFALTGHSSASKNFHDSQQVAPGTQPLPLVRAGNVAIGPSVCSSITSPFFGPHFRQAGATILTNSASLVFLRSATFYHTQEHYMLRYQAIASGLPLVHASRTGTSFIIDGNGKVLAQTFGSIDQAQIISARLTL